MKQPIDSQELNHTVTEIKMKDESLRVTITNDPKKAMDWVTEVLMEGHKTLGMDLE